MKKYNGESLIDAIGDVDPEMLNIPSRKSIAGRIFSKITVAASVLLCFSVVTIFFINIVLGGSMSEAPGDMANSSPPAAEGDDLVNGPTADAPENGDGALPPGDGEDAGGEGSADADNNAAEAPTPLSCLRIGYDGRLLNGAVITDSLDVVYVAAVNGYLEIYLELFPEVNYSVTEDGNELDYELTAYDAHRLYKLQGEGEIIIEASEFFSAGSVRSIAYRYADGMFELIITYY